MQLLGISSVLLWVVVLANLFLTFVLIRRFNQGFQKDSQSFQIVDLPIGNTAPNFVAETLEGQQISLSNYLGNNIALLFVSPYCKACIDELPNYDALSTRAKKANILLILVSLAALDETRSFAEKFNIRLPVLSIAQETSFKEDYKVMGTPSYCLVDNKGKITAAGYVNELEALIQTL